MPPFAGAIQWLNSPPLTAASLRGKVVLVDFWTYTCINWRRHYPYVRAWAEKYRDHGLVVIGVHAPEFSFEHDLANVRTATKELRVDYPVAIDNDYAIWRAFDNHYWPALYFADAEGRLRHHQFGEGDYVQSEKIIQQLLVEGRARDVGGGVVSAHAEGLEAAADWHDLRSPETYLGYERAESFASPGGAASDARHVYDAPRRLSLNHWALSGDWTVASEAAVLNEVNGRITCRFHARDLHLVLAPPARDRPVPFRVTVDGAPPAQAHGVDVSAEGRGSVQDPRLYQLVRQSAPITDRTFEIEFLDAGVRAYVFTFG
ncbi:MAG TPA: thioredoxin family protein [Stellaceae bacterium]|nr:thioredoxin family protein [Stellaceae bacterium]